MSPKRVPRPLAPLGDSRQLARDAWQSLGSDPFSTVSRDSMHAIAYDDPETHAALADEGAAFGSVLDLHLVEESAPEHSVAATALTNFVQGLAEAVKEISKHALHRERYRTNLLLTGIAFGSVRVSVATPPQQTAKNADTLERTFVEDVDAQSLALVTALLSQDPDADDSAMEALASSLPIAARAKLRKASAQIEKSGWSVTGTFSRPGRRREIVSFDSLTARRVGAALASSHHESKHVTMSGRVDGNRRSLLVMYFDPDKGRPFAAAVPDTDLYERVVGLASQDLSVVAQFRVDAVVAAGTDSAVRTSHTLEGIQPANEQGELI